MKNFSELLTSGRTLHAVCFTGDDAQNCAKFAERAAQIFLCNNRKPDNPAPCETCESCKKALANLHPDIIRVRETAKDQKYTVALLRDTVTSANLRPNDGDLKVYILTNADTMRPDSQNTLLKFTEEPPEFVRIIFTAKSPDGFLETIKSRFVFINTDTEKSSTEVKPEHAEIAKSFTNALLNNNEYRAATALAKIKTRDDLSAVLDLVSLAIRDEIVNNKGDAQKLITAQKFITARINQLQFNPNIALATTHITRGVFN
ncbi:MAG: hypothetical protein FWH20_02030 [Oscillospiraceae bacterium]|nr:hypothetical protein [Oscillospiraceae bacterium]